MLSVVTATEFIKIMKSGRTAPILCRCAHENGKSAGEFVVKLRQSIGGTRGLLQEFLGSRLASHFGILVPEAVAVNIDLEFAEALEEQDRNLAASAKASIGLNFGSTMINPAATTWLVERTIPDAMWRDAVNIFAFDALIQNPDRRSANPNLFTQGDSIYVYDHETSFSFLLAVVRSAEPWNLEREEYLTQHVFYRRLKSKEIDLDDFEARLQALTGDVLAQVREEIPDEWMHADLEQIEAHLSAVRDHHEQFREQLRRRLA